MAQRDEIEARLKEQRMAEATKKGLMGPSGKIGTVLKSMGSPIVSQTEMSTPLDLEGRGEDGVEAMPTIYMDGVERPSGQEWSDSEVEATPYSIHSIGRHFDGLGRGMHIEIFYKDESSEMSVYHKGHLVYREAQGDLLCYVPSEEWEGWVSSLFKVAKRVQREEKERDFQSKVQEAERSKMSWLRDLASRWGLT